MILPNKLIGFQDSIIAKMIYILDAVSLEDQSISSLYNKVKNNFEDINQYILALDVLFTLEKVEFNEKAQVITYVKTDNL
ncbi:ABC-three component system middle component 7 [Sporomusa sphaeroides]|uniref:Uncharacterized protein n=1 Tax=Sporomusa sphaeroides DSM 2875 TaxID=1337886 RepID=A0ABM9W829_9FIRM|nr:ABC-three component system middle component 7 [Sporomusa sphaeroides]OLS57638.1 hypothetical protein SPSPH_11540 [Sporomusa sphaeroides DSM 2875]CVK21337.1 hypothetical protein SSPH_04024 [Sporomusa sphaeroides DSM 2875]